MIKLENDSQSYKALASNLNEVAKGTHYLRVKSDKLGGLFFETVAKKKDLFGRITQFFTRLFDSSYNINKGSALLFKCLDNISSAPLGAVERIYEAENALLKIVTHVNEKRFLGKASLPQWAQTAAKTTQVVSGTASPALRYRILKEGLETWSAEGAEGEKRAEAKARILACCSQRTPILDLSKLALTNLPPEIGMLTHLESLNVHENKLTTLPPEIGTLFKLDALNVYENQLTTLPAEIGNLRSLQIISASFNKLETLPEEIGNLASLNYLDLEKNKLTTLPKTIGKLAHLTNLSLCNNQLRELPEETENLKSLREIDLSQNSDLKSIPENLCKLTSLRDIRISPEKRSLIPRSGVTATVIEMT